MTRYRIQFAVLTGFALAALPCGARAGTLDKALLDKSIDVLAYLKENSLQHVGVLPFQVKRGSRRSQYVGAPLATNLPRRIENALIMSMDPEDESKAVGVIRDAASQAGKARVGEYTTNKSAFERLFDVKYDLAWSDRKVTADGFLTGAVSNDGENRRTTTVVLNLITRKSWEGGKIKPTKTWTLLVPTDAMLAADLGYNFALSRQALQPGVTSTQREDAIVNEAAFTDQEGTKVDTTTNPLQSDDFTPTNIAGFEFELRYDKKAQRLTRSSGMKEGSHALTFNAPPAMLGSKISMHLKRLQDTGDGKFGVVLMVNGTSTLDRETGDPLNLRRWTSGVEKKGVFEDWDGFYETQANGELKCFEFDVLTAEESATKAAELGSMAGWIEVFIFGNQEGEAKPGADSDTMFITTRAMPSGPKKTLSLKDLRTQVMKANNVKEQVSLVKRRSVGGLIFHKLEPVAAGTFKSDSLPNPVLLGHLAIRYYEPTPRAVEKE